jgi:hypothetical protein
MTDTLQQIALSRALKTLDAIGAQYAVIYDDETYGTLKLAPLPRQRKDGRTPYKRGTTRAHYWPYIENLQPGDETKIPYLDFDSTVLMSNVCAACTHNWGNKTYISQRDDSAQTVNILRIA